MQAVYKPSQVSQGNSQPMLKFKLSLASIGYPSEESVLILNAVEIESPSIEVAGFVTSWSKKAISVLAGTSFTSKDFIILITFVVVIVYPVVLSYFVSLGTKHSVFLLAVLIGVQKTFSRLLK